LTSGGTVMPTAQAELDEAAQPEQVRRPNPGTWLPQMGSRRPGQRRANAAAPGHRHESDQPLSGADPEMLTEIWEN
jgi:hypothetical protein